LTFAVATRFLAIGVPEVPALADAIHVAARRRQTVRRLERFTQP
jgi:hypothetical protein